MRWLRIGSNPAGLPEGPAPDGSSVAVAQATRDGVDPRQSRAWREHAPSDGAAPHTFVPYQALAGSKAAATLESPPQPSDRAKTIRR
jgi:hypothetical protein